jgi:hypothetical protein
MSAVGHQPEAQRSPTFVIHRHRPGVWPSLRPSQIRHSRPVQSSDGSATNGLDRPSDRALSDAARRRIASQAHADTTRRRQMPVLRAVAEGRLLAVRSVQLFPTFSKSDQSTPR